MQHIKTWIFLTLIVSVTLTASAQKKQLTPAHYFTGSTGDIVANMRDFRAGTLFGYWVDHQNFTLYDAGKYYRVNVKSGKRTEIADADFRAPFKAGKTLILKNNDLYYGDKQLTHDSIPENNYSISPDQNFVAFTKLNDLYTIELNTGKQYRLTQDGSDLILNGYASWVYMEEILGRAGGYRAFWWSEDSKNIIYFRSDDSRVPEFIITDAPGLHGVVEKTRYPKVGDPNPEVKVGIVSSTGGETIWADFDEKQDQYFGAPIWKSGKLLQPWMNRLQNELIVYELDPRTGKKEPFYTETQKTWIDLGDYNRFHFFENGKNVIISSDKSGWNHLYLYDLQGNLINPITSGNFTVTGIRKLDEKKKQVYFTAKGLENSARTDFYRIDLNGKGLTRLSFGDFNHSIGAISPDGNYFLDIYSNASTVSEIAVVNNKGKIVFPISSMKGPDFDDYEIAKTELIRVKSKDGLFDLPMRVTWPLNMEPGKKYPVLVSIYGGPGSTSVTDNWNFSGQEQYYAKEGLIQVSMDHRGSGHFGKKGMNYMYHNLGYWEMEDYGTLVEWLIANGQADPQKVCITGFSYGGYLSSYALTYGADIFTHAMAGGSVIDWTLYDTHYTERFMGTPANNPKGYKSSAVLSHIDKFKGKLMLVHGSIDDNVHLQNSIWFATALQERKKDFDMMFYSGQRHGIRGNQGLHFQNLKTKFIHTHLLEKPVPEQMLR